MDGDAVVIVTRRNGPLFAINPDLLERIDSVPDTILTLVDGTKRIVQESVGDVIGHIVAYRAIVVARAQDSQQMAVDVVGMLAVQAGANPHLVGKRLRSMLAVDGKAKAAKCEKEAA